MTTINISAASCWAALSLAACTSGGTSPGQPYYDYSSTSIPPRCQAPLISGSGVVRATATGGTTVDGEYEMCGNGNVDNDGSLSMGGKIEIAGGSELFGVSLGVPVAIYDGPGTYQCGFEYNKTWDQSVYCDVSAIHRVDEPSGELEWLAAASHNAGPFPDCFITIEVGPPDGIKGTYQCLNLPAGAIIAVGPQPNEGTIMSVSGDFEFIPSDY